MGYLFAWEIRDRRQELDYPVDVDKRGVLVRARAIVLLASSETFLITLFRHGYSMALLVSRASNRAQVVFSARDVSPRSLSFIIHCISRSFSSCSSCSLGTFKFY